MCSISANSDPENLSCYFSVVQIWTHLKSWLDSTCFFHCFFFFSCCFGLMACGILAPGPGIELALPAFESEVLTTRPPGKSQQAHILLKMKLMFRKTGGSFSSGRFFFPMYSISSVQFSRSVVSNCVTPWTAASQASLSITNSRNLLKLMSIELMMPSNHLILCHPLLLLPSIFPSIKIFSNEFALCIGWPKSIGASLEKGMPSHFSILALRTP